MSHFRHALLATALVAAGAGVAAARNPSLVTDNATCGEYGTAVHFESTPVEAARQAARDGKLVLVLHISGHFEDPGLT